MRGVEGRRARELRLRRAHERGVERDAVLRLRAGEQQARRLVRVGRRELEAARCGTEERAHHRRLGVEQRRRRHEHRRVAVRDPKVLRSPT